MVKSNFSILFLASQPCLKRETVAPPLTNTISLPFVCPSWQCTGDVSDSILVCVWTRRHGRGDPGQVRQSPDRGHRVYYLRHVQQRYGYSPPQHAHRHDVALLREHYGMRDNTFVFILK